MKRSALAVLGFYVIAIGATVAAYLAIESYGENLFPSTAAAAIEGAHPINHVLQVLLALVVVILAARIVGGIFAFIHQPPVIGEVIGGILLGPSLLGHIAPGVLTYVFPSTVAPFLGVIAQLGIILYMFLVGLELDLRVLRRSGHAALAVSHASIAVPFLMGAALALNLYPRFGTAETGFTPFSLFMGVAMSVTAFPVLARILTDKGLHKTRIGTLALTCAAIDDVTAWCLLALVVSVAQATVHKAVVTFIGTILYIAFMFLVARPLIRKAVLGLEKFKRVQEGQLALVCLGLLSSALATEYIGIHAIFGAFLFGAIIPHQSNVAHDMTARLHDLVRVLFLPAFFAFTGMRTEVGLLNGLEDWLLCGMIVWFATAGKFGGTLLAARFAGVSWRESAALGALMNTRGLVELIVLNIGLDLKVISPRLFTMLVIMALVTTFLTGPLLRIIVGKRKLE